MVRVAVSALFMMIVLVTSVPVAHAKVARAVQDGFDRVRATCLTENSLELYQPRFTTLENNNTSGFGSSINTKVLKPSLVGIPYRGRKDATAVAYRELKQEIEAYIAEHELSGFKRACVYQCAANSYFQGGLRGVGFDAFLSVRKNDFKKARGDCVHTSLMAYDLANEHMDIHVTTTSLWYNVDRGSGHAFTVLNVDGAKYVMNNNWGWDEMCVFRAGR
ncbi:MAG TPA: hypothetical protein PLH57_09500 [Oligoflexia bacterium]|nr:hypothetical protein [Oligoflexia bacterium]